MLPKEVPHESPLDTVVWLNEVKRNPQRENFGGVRGCLAPEENPIVRLNAFKVMLLVPHEGAPAELVNVLGRESGSEIFELMCKELASYSGEHMGKVMQAFPLLPDETRDKVKEFLKRHGAPEDHPLLTGKAAPKKGPATELDELFKPF